MLTCATRSTPRPASVVAELEIVGNRALSDREIARALVTSETSWWPLAKKHLFDPTAWQSDLRRVRRYYQARGYYGARVVASRVEQRDDGVHLQVEVHEGEPMAIQSLTLRGLEPLTTTEHDEIKDDLPLAQGDVFEEADWNAAKTLLGTRLRAFSFAAAEVEGRAIADVGKHKAQLEIVARPGERHRFGTLTIDQERQNRIDRTFIEEQIRLAIVPDERYSPEALVEAQRRVFGMGVFSTARVAEGSPDPATHRVPIEVSVREAPFHSLRLGGGVGIDQVRQELRLLSEWTDRNFLGGLRKLSLQGMGGWAFMPSVQAVARGQREVGPRHGPIFRADAELEQPRLFARPTLTGRALLEGERTLEEAYDAIGGRTSAGVIWRPQSSIALFPAYQFQIYRLDGPAAVRARAAPLTIGCASDPCLIILSFLEQLITFDQRDDPLEPRQGYFFGLSLQEGGGPLGGDFRYLRVLPDARGYFSFSDDVPATFAAKLRVGSLVPASGDPVDSPVTARFYSGGANAMRGFGTRRLSPLLLSPPPDSAGDEPLLTLPVGGNGLIEGSFELRYGFSPALIGALFADYATVIRRRLPIRDPRGLLWALGVGARYLTPIGPFRIDFGVRLPFGTPPPLYDINGTEITYRRLPGGGTEPGTETGANINRTCFGIGGANTMTWVRDGLCTLHLSIGEAF